MWRRPRRRTHHRTTRRPRTLPPIPPRGHELRAESVAHRLLRRYLVRHHCHRSLISERDAQRLAQSPHSKRSGPSASTVQQRPSTATPCRRSSTSVPSLGRTGRRRDARRGPNGNHGFPFKSRAATGFSLVAPTGGVGPSAPTENGLAIPVPNMAAAHDPDLNGRGWRSGGEGDVPTMTEAGVTETTDGDDPARRGNWGRWGADDERGALNLIGSAEVLTGVAACRTGKTYPLGLRVQRKGVPVVDFRPAPERYTLFRDTDADDVPQARFRRHARLQRGRRDDPDAQRHPHGRAQPLPRRRARSTTGSPPTSSRPTAARRAAASRRSAPSSGGPSCSTSPAISASTGWSPDSP